MIAPRLLFAALAIATAFATLANDASATRFRRPFDPALAVGYGFDTNGGAAGCRDYNCGTVCYDGHTGEDFPLPLGTNVLAGAEGRVDTVNNGCANYGSVGNTCGGRCGNYVRITHPDGTRTIYCHMMLSSIVVSVGTTVHCGQLLGRSASSGSSSGPHLHFGWQRSGVSTDVYTGSCTSSPGAWVMQNGYRAAVGAACECVAGAEVCNGRDDNCDGRVDEGVTNACGRCGAVPAEVCNGMDDDCDGAADEDGICERDMMIRSANAYAPARTSDLNGDGRADVCGRGISGFWCMLANADGTFTRSEIAPLSNTNGWSDPSNYATIRMGDVTGDGRADLCARADDGWHCWASTGTGFAAEYAGPPIGDASGWGNPEYFTTLRLADFNGDGRDDLCARGAAGLHCWPSTGSGFGAMVNGPAWSDAIGYNAARFYGTLRMGDIDGDGRDDACIRNSDGIECYLSDGSGFPTRISGPAWADRHGWNDAAYWSTIRLADVDGDHRADLCARASDALYCALSTGNGFAAAIVVAPLADAQGWNDPSNYETLRVGDVDGDGAAELCARANDRVLCWHWTGTEFARFDGPEWSDANGWAAHEHYGTIALGDVDGDRRADVCARAAAGWICERSTGAGFSGALSIPEYTNAGGWSPPEHYTTIQFGGPACGGRRCVPDAGADGGIADGGDAATDDGGIQDAGARDASGATDARLRDGGSVGDGAARGDAGPLGATGTCQCSSVRPVRARGPLASATFIALVALGRRTRRRAGRIQTRS